MLHTRQHSANAYTEEMDILRQSGNGTSQTDFVIIRTTRHSST